jgi:transcriptional regulator with XRE-family HTH domain
MALSQDGAAFRSWRKNRKMNQDEAADALGISARMIKYYEAGQHAIPKTIKLAMAGYDATRAA